MLATIEIIKHYLKLSLSLSLADSVTLYLPFLSSSLSKDVLLKEGGSIGVPELVSRQSAELYLTQIESKCQVKQLDIFGVSIFMVKSRQQCGWLLGVPLRHWQNVDDQGSSRVRRSDKQTEKLVPLECAWLGLFYGNSPSPDFLVNYYHEESVNNEQVLKHWFWNLMNLGRAIAGYSYDVVMTQQDSLTQLPERNVFQKIILNRAQSKVSFTLLLINPDDFNIINERLGRESGDLVMRAIAERITEKLRQTDSVCRYGGALFAAMIDDTVIDEGRVVAESLLQLLTESAYLDGKFRLTFSIGAAGYAFSESLPQADIVTVLTRRADLALKAAKLSGGSNVCCWGLDKVKEAGGSPDQLTGVFTASSSKDYRNMMLLWDMISIVSASVNFNTLSSKFITRLLHTFDFNRLCLFKVNKEKDFQVVAGFEQLNGGCKELLEGERFSLALEQQGLLNHVFEMHTEPNYSMGEVRDVNQDILQCYVLPLLVGKQVLGALYLECREGTQQLDASDLIFLNALASQLAGVFERVALELELNERKEKERVRLRTELNDLRRAVRETRLLYRSSQMEALLVGLRQVATTDANVLIYGESGTGKELLARTIHEFSPRHNKPIVIVDCGAISESLIESELFGHEKGAFTGAEKRTQGHLAQADGGTLVLDEIGELPLAVQAKFLRLVQEKQYTPVGSSQTQTVDVRLVAATNRNLADEVASGRFREDLYYRLNVVTMVSPPLRDRPEDIPYLAAHFLRKFALQYQKPVNAFSQELREEMVAYQWPGNVRELQNWVQRAVIFATDHVISKTNVSLSKSLGFASSDIVLSDKFQPSGFCELSDGKKKETSPEDFWQQILEALDKQIATTVSGEVDIVPIGVWLCDDLIQVAYELSKGVARRAAKLLGMPSSTYSRRLHQLHLKESNGTMNRPESWQYLKGILPKLIQAHNGESDLVKRLQRQLIRQIYRHQSFSVRLAADLMGISEPTVNHWLADFAS